MAFSEIITLSDPPQRDQDEETFAPRADVFLVELQQFSEDLNTFKGELETAAALIAAAPAYADAGLVSIAGISIGANEILYGTGTDTFATQTLTPFARTLIDDGDAATARTTLGLGTMATQAASGIAVTGGSITGITDLAVADGGTGASTAAGARTNLGAAASGANSDITSLSALTTALSVAQGGTGVTTLAALMSSLFTITSDSNGTCLAFTIGATTYKLQWGRVSATANSSGTITFPSAFTTASSISVTKGGSNYGGPADQDNYADINGTPTTTTVGWGNPDDTTATLMWIAIGY